MSQLTFEILLNPSVQDDDIKRLSRQCQMIYHKLCMGKIKTSQLARIAKLYNARLNEIRHMVVKHGKMIDCIKGQGGENTYVMVPLRKSSFWEKVVKKNEQWKWEKK